MSKVTIKFEGPAGSGKTLLSEKVRRLLLAAGIDVSDDRDSDDLSVTVDPARMAAGAYIKDSRPRMAPEKSEAERDIDRQHAAIKADARNGVVKAGGYDRERDGYKGVYNKHYHADGTPKRMREDGSTF